MKLKTLDKIFERLDKSDFRKSFMLNNKEYEYLNKKGLDTIMEHADYFIDSRLTPAYPKNDGKQTPMGNHPVFIAQHATGTCCRSCLFKWHRIKKNKELSTREKQYIMHVIKIWLCNQINPCSR